MGSLPAKEDYYKNVSTAAVVVHVNEQAFTLLNVIHRLSPRALAPSS
jgi:hypothetical protein